MDEVLTTADASSSSRSFNSSPILPSNLPILSAFLAFVIAQFLKLFTTWMFGSGGMPSSHSAIVTALAVAIGFHDGTGTSSFVLVVVLAAVAIVCGSIFSSLGIHLSCSTISGSDFVALNAPEVSPQGIVFSFFILFSFSLKKLVCYNIVTLLYFLANSISFPVVFGGVLSFICFFCVRT
ncbi:hypothetical protein MKX03_034109 [Papaver bracteatum]|nr:hypothetical protein MKX03_034109 [Papaver bracteatum]